MRTVEQILDSFDTSDLPRFNRDQFLVYCNFMMFENNGTNTPPAVVTEQYYRSLFKYIEMLYEEQFEKEFLDNLAS